MRKLRDTSSEALSCTEMLDQMIHNSKALLEPTMLSNQTTMPESIFEHHYNTLL